MAVTQNSYVGNGSTTTYSFTFPYLKEADIKAQIDADVTTAFTLPTATTLQFNTAPANGTKIKIYRETDDEALTATFYAGSSIKSEDLNDNATQNLYATQEINARYLSNLGGTMVGDLTMDEDAEIIFEGATADAYETTLTVVDPTADRTVSLPNETGTLITNNSTNVVTSAMIVDGAVATADIANDAINGTKIADDSIDSEHLAADSIDTEHYAPNSVDTTAIANDAITGGQIADDAVNSEHLAADSIDAEHYAPGSVDATALASNAVITAKIAADAIDGTKIADDSINSEHYVAASIDNEHLADDAVGADELAADAVVNASVTAGAAIEFTKLENLDASKILVGNGSNKATEVSLTGDITINNAGVSAIGANTVEIGMLDCEQTTISDSDSHVPTSGAVVDYVAGQIAPIGGFEVIADDESFPNTQPGTGVVISISDAAGLSINSSGVSTNADTLDNTTVTINGFPSELRGGVGGNADPYVLGSGTGLMVKSTGSSQTYDYHQVMIKESDFVQLSDDINDFNSRYRIGTRTANNSNTNDDGDLFFDTGTNKMYVYDGAYDSGGSWGEVTSTGEFKVLGVKNNGAAHDGALSFGSATQYDLFEGTNDANITQAAQLIVVLNGVVQKPNDGSYDNSQEGFYLDGADGIQFCSVPPSGSTLFVTKCGSAVSINTPADNSVTAGKLDLSIVQGDVIYGTGTDAWARLAKGTAGQVLKMNSGATAPEWGTDAETPEGTTVKSTGVSGTTNYLRADGDGTCSWQAVATTPTDITVADESTDTSCNVLFVTAETGDLAPKTGTNLTFNSNTGALGATSYTGDGSALTGVAAASADGCMYKNTLTISNAHTIAATEGAHSVGPVTLNNTVTVNGRWVIS
tara:strand:- start:4 stop:2622 length:2619 start_codon:yes stop_codon:yes gene_type:complete